MRNLVNIIECIPEEHSRIIPGLKDLRSSASCAAPEMMYFWWGELALFLDFELKEPDEEWKEKILKIMKNEE